MTKPDKSRKRKNGGTIKPPTYAQRQLHERAMAELEGFKASLPKWERKKLGSGINYSTTIKASAPKLSRQGRERDRLRRQREAQLKAERAAYEERKTQTGRADLGE